MSKPVIVSDGFTAVVFYGSIGNADMLLHDCVSRVVVDIFRLSRNLVHMLLGDQSIST